MRKAGFLKSVCTFTIICFALLAGGCNTYLAFSTATKFGVDISQRADQTIDVLMGYQRVEVGSIPVPKFLAGAISSFAASLTK